MENLMERKIEKKMGSNRANLVGGLIGLTFGLIVSIAVVLPITQDVIDAENFTGTTATIVNIIPVFVALIPMVLAAGFLNI